MRSRWFSTFTVIGLILIVIGLVGLGLGPHFIFEPGQPHPDPKTPWYYLAIGALMIVNGLATPAPSPEETRETKSAQPRAASGSVAAATDKPNPL